MIVEDATMDHRQGKRYQLLKLAKILYSDGQLAEGTINDISTDGMYVASETEAEIKGRVHVYISTTQPCVAPVQITGRIIHHNGNGFGMMFSALDDAGRIFVEKHLNS